MIRTPINGLTYDAMCLWWGQQTVEALFVRVDTYKLN